MLDDIYTSFCSIIHEDMKKYIPLKKCKKKGVHKPWWNASLRRAREKVHRAEKKWLHCSNDLLLRSVYHRMYRVRRREFCKLVRKAKRKHKAYCLQKLESCMCSNQGKFWAEAHHFMGRARAVSIPLYTNYEKWRASNR